MSGNTVPLQTTPSAAETKLTAERDGARELIREIWEMDDFVCLGAGKPFEDDVESRLRNWGMLEKKEEAKAS